MAGRGFQSLPTSYKLVPSSLRQIAVGANLSLSGKTNNTGVLTLTPNVATMVFQHPLLGVDSHVSFSPLTANAAAEIGNGTMYTLAANKAKQMHTITIANNANADRTFSYSILG